MKKVAVITQKDNTPIMVIKDIDYAHNFYMKHQTKTNYYIVKYDNK